MRIRPAIATLFASFLFPAVSFAATQYLVTLLPPVPGSYQMIALAISPAGVVGYSIFLNGDQYITYPVLWQNGQVSSLPIPNGYQGGAFAINAFGDIAGSISIPNSNQPQPVAWHNGQLQPLDKLGLQQGTPYGINDQGVTVGEVDGGVDGPQFAVMWKNGQATSLLDSGTALAINNAGQVLLLGPSSQSIWLNGSTTPITAPAGTQFFVPRYLNDLGHVAGNLGYTNDAINEYGFISVGDLTAQLPNLPADNFGFPRAINNSDQLVGSGDDGHGDVQALLWQNAEVFDLNTLIPSDSGWNLLEADDIADNGQIVGYGQINGQLQAFLLTPIPEPATLSLLLIPLLLSSRRRAHNSPLIRNSRRKKSVA